ncbi:MAG: primosomal protein DnaI [Clostridia bacterium]
MDSIGTFFEELAKRSPRTIRTPDQQLDKMLQSSAYLQEFHRQHAELTRDDLLRSLSMVYTAVKEQYCCQKCTTLAECPNLVKGHVTVLDVQNRQIVSAISSCSKFLAHEEMQRSRKLMRSYYVAEQTLLADFATTLEIDVDNQAAVAAAVRFCDDFTLGKKPKGLYVHGPFGVGKSFLMGAVARELSKHNVPSLMVYVPDFVREIKESIADQSYTSKLELLKEIPVLILDDIGAESLTPWIRDEILGVILHSRISKQLPTLYTSNYSLEELEEHLSISNGNRIESTKAARIMERIRHYVEVCEVDGENRRLHV